jgi:hypothetical protein
MDEAGAGDGSSDDDVGCVSLSEPQPAKSTDMAAIANDDPRRTHRFPLPHAQSGLILSGFSPRDKAQRREQQKSVPRDDRD